MTSPKRNGTTTIELLMEIVAPVVGSIAFAVALTTLTPLPTWVCLLIAIPTGTIASWAFVIGVFWFAASIGDAIQRKRGEPDDARESPS